MSDDELFSDLEISATDEDDLAVAETVVEEEAAPGQDKTDPAKEEAIEATDRQRASPIRPKPDSSSSSPVCDAIESHVMYSDSSPASGPSLGSVRERDVAVVKHRKQQEDCQALSRRASAFSIDSLLREPHQGHSTSPEASDGTNISKRKWSHSSTGNVDLPNCTQEQNRRVAKRIKSDENREAETMELGKRNDRKSDNSAITDAAAEAGASLLSSPAASSRRCEQGRCRSSGTRDAGRDAAADGEAEVVRWARGRDALSLQPEAEFEGVTCRLDGQELWSKFHELGTEMIITKSGRRMFPVLSASFSGLLPNEAYLVAADMVPVDNKRYRYTYHRSAWLVAGRADPQPATSGLHVHPDCPMTGKMLNRHPVAFDRIKLTNCPSGTGDKTGHIVLTSMHKYLPRIHLIRRRAVADAALVAMAAATDHRAHCHPSSQQDAADHILGIQLQKLKKGSYRTFVFPETEFIAVTAYQNQMITKLKIDSNPFAKGFRESTRISDLEREPCSGEFLLGVESGFGDLACPPPSSSHIPAPYLLPDLYPGAIYPIGIPLPKISVDPKGHSEALVDRCKTSCYAEVFPLPSTVSSNHVSSATSDRPPVSNIERCLSGMPTTSQRRHTKLQELDTPSFHSRDQFNRFVRDFGVKDREEQMALQSRQPSNLFRMLSMINHSSSRPTLSPTTNDFVLPDVLNRTSSNQSVATTYHPYLAARKLHSSTLPS